MCGKQVLFSIVSLNKYFQDLPAKRFNKAVKSKKKNKLNDNKNNVN